MPWIWWYSPAAPPSTDVLRLLDCSPRVRALRDGGVLIRVRVSELDAYYLARPGLHLPHRSWRSVFHWWVHWCDHVLDQLCALEDAGAAHGNVGSRSVAWLPCGRARLMPVFASTPTHDGEALVQWLRRWLARWAAQVPTHGTWVRAWHTALCEHKAAPSCWALRTQWRWLRSAWPWAPVSDTKRFLFTGDDGDEYGVPSDDVDSGLPSSAR